MTPFDATTAGELVRQAREDDEDRVSPGEWIERNTDTLADISRTRALPRALADQLEAACTEVERLKDLNGRVIPYGLIAATARAASQPPVHVEPDDSFGGPNQTRYRIVRDEDERRFRDDYKTTARPPYIATMYSREDADFVSLLYNHGHHLVVQFNALKSQLSTALRERDEARGECERMRAERDENGSIISKVNDAIGRAGIHCAITFWEAIDQIAAERDRLQSRAANLTSEDREALIDAQRWERALRAVVRAVLG
jgi:hypothetical protein